MKINHLFREKSLEKVSSPDSLNDYIKVENPKSWLVLSAVAVLLIGVCVWGIFGRMKSSLKVVAVSDGVKTVCFVPEDSAQNVEADMKVVIDNQEYRISKINTTPEKASRCMGEYEMHISDIQSDEWVYVVALDHAVEAGIYQANIITESISPASFVIN